MPAGRKAYGSHVLGHALAHSLHSPPDASQRSDSDWAWTAPIAAAMASTAASLPIVIIILDWSRGGLERPDALHEKKEDMRVVRERERERAVPRFEFLDVLFLFKYIKQSLECRHPKQIYLKQWFEREREKPNEPFLAEPQRISYLQSKRPRY